MYGSSVPTTKQIISTALHEIERNLAYSWYTQHLEMVEKIKALNILSVDKLFCNVCLVGHYFSHTYRGEVIRKKQWRFSERHLIPRILQIKGTASKTIMNLMPAMNYLQI